MWRYFGLTTEAEPMVEQTGTEAELEKLRIELGNLSQIMK